MRRRSTLKEVAAALDLSVATVSRALGGYEDIAVETRRRVAEKARELGYVPNMAGRMLVSGRSGFVGLVLPIRGPNFVDSFLGQFVTGLGEGLVAKGVDLMIATASAGQSELDVLKHLVHSGRADGVVLTRIAEEDERVRFLMERRFPFVVHGRLSDEEAPYSWLDTSGEAAFRQAFECLYGLGHRHFGLVTISDRMTFRRHREAGLEAAIAEAADPQVELWVARSPRFDDDSHRAAIREMLSGEDRPTAVIGLFDELALLVLHEAQSMGLAVPQDLSVTGFDNVPAAGFSPPGLTTFDQATRESGREIAGMLTALIEDGKDGPLSSLKVPRFIERGSHGPAPQSGRPRIRQI
ncbi:LacI family DNA-binding transcriptional regulator [Chelativorans salis]|uniref:Substrate-binding domain-containing protein n=1 Tax=Chelativorans salis TaxID=2978478 RepID=A0ABT2LGB6_9HYPH|nr:substrate-binding domain-containing protein [Chelativorans sp. EGI FJ00035]MCT7373506.1 substrate-binding domain-containing protein [Chelativorans sp. EGI FJ00035]